MLTGWLEKTLSGMNALTVWVIDPESCSPWAPFMNRSTTLEQRSCGMTMDEELPFPGVLEGSSL